MSSGVYSRTIVYSRTKEQKTGSFPLSQNPYPVQCRRVDWEAHACGGVTELSIKLSREIRMEPLHLPKSRPGLGFLGTKKGLLPGSTSLPGL